MRRPMKTGNVMLWVALCVALTACSTVPLPADAPARPDAMVGTWFSPPSDFPGICMHFGPDGALKFSGGFAFFNPARWQHDVAARELRLELGGSGDFPAPLEAAKPGLPNQGALLRFDAAKRTLTYRLEPRTTMIDVGGFKFYRARACVAQK